ncbi:MAG TPA: cbb3-type cytochrome oxidase assembly protein CcoS [Gammaproteobacteria bacterium]|jgi:cbb3-type cytochrome oxidase maturation protein
MDVLYILLPVSVALAFLIALVFFVSVRSGQFDDLEGPAYRVLDDDDGAPPDAIDGDRDNDKGTGSD